MVKEQVDLLTQKEASKMVKRSTSSYDVETDKLDLISKDDDTVLTDASPTNTTKVSKNLFKYIKRWQLLCNFSQYGTC